VLQVQEEAPQIMMAAIYSSCIAHIKKTLSNILWENLCFRKYLQINRRIWKILINLRGKEQPYQIHHNLKYF
jgi:hypothetical protein